MRRHGPAGAWIRNIAGTGRSGSACSGARDRDMIVSVTFDINDSKAHTGDGTEDELRRQ